MEDLPNEMLEEDNPSTSKFSNVSSSAQMKNKKIVTKKQGSQESKESQSEEDAEEAKVKVAFSFAYLQQPLCLNPYPFAFRSRKNKRSQKKLPLLRLPLHEKRVYVGWTNSNY